MKRGGRWWVGNTSGKKGVTPPFPPILSLLGTGAIVQKIKNLFKIYRLACHAVGAAQKIDNDVKTGIYFPDQLQINAPTRSSP